MKFKNGFIFLITLVIFFSIFISCAEVSVAITNEKTSMEFLFEDVRSFLIENYKDYYELNNFQFEVSEEDSDSNFISFVVKCDMMLIKKPDELPFIKGFNDKTLKSYNNIMVDNYYDNLLTNITNEYYMKPEESTFTFIIKKESEKILSNVKVLNFNEILPLNSLEIHFDELYSQGIAAVEDINIDLIRLNNIKSSPVYPWKYNRITAKNYAIQHANDEPEYSSDCANFVSKCLNRGGIPKTSSWSPGKPNWIRTGYNGNGGVVPYMVDKGYFYKESNRSKVYAGSIVYWNSKSHVGLITSGDTVVLRYSAHTSPRCNEILPSSENVSLYMPATWIQ